MSHRWLAEHKIIKCHFNISSRHVLNIWKFCCHHFYVENKFAWVRCKNDNNCIVTCRFISNCVFKYIYLYIYIYLSSKIKTWAYFVRYKTLEYIWNLKQRKYSRLPEWRELRPSGGVCWITKETLKIENKRTKKKRSERNLICNTTL